MNNCYNLSYMSRICFGTGGWRAVIGEEFIKENVERIAQAIFELLEKDNKTNKPVIIGHDRRFLSERATWWISSVLAANGITCQLLKRSSPTPLIMHTVKREAIHIGLEVTASHNPPEYNGIKVIVDEGRDAPVEVTEKIECIANSPELKVKSMDFEKAVKLGLVEFIKNPFNQFVDDILDMLDVKAIRERGLRIAFDPMHGSGTYPLLVILNTTRCTVDLINSNKDAYFDGSFPTPTESTLQDLKRMVVKDGYDLGIAFDGDGDRLGIIDPSGTFITSNQILVMLYWYLHEKKHWKGGVVRNISTTHILDRMAKAFNEKCIEVPVGFKWVSAAIDKYDAVLGGESSGGLTVRGHIHGKDSVYASYLFVEMLSVTDMTPLEIIKMLEKEYGKTYFEDLAISFTSKNKKKTVENKLLEEKAIPAFSEKIDEISYLDGVKVLFKNGDFVSCRFSGTEPVLRIISEAETQEKALYYVDTFKLFISSLLSSDKGPVFSSMV